MNKKNTILIYILINFLFILLLYFSGNPFHSVLAKESDKKDFYLKMRPDSLPYLGQQRPDTIPLRFGPSYLISNGIWLWHGSPKISPDGKEMFFVKYQNNKTSMYFMQDVNGQWTMPASPSFSSDSIDNSPVYSGDGNKLFFTSNRSGSMKIYFVTRITNGWSQPQLLNFDYQSLPGSMGWDFSFTKDSAIYFTLYHSTDGMEIYKAKLLNGQYSQFEKLPPQINTSYNEATPFIESDEKYILFMSNRPGSYGYHDIYISFKKSDSSWTQAQNMGNKINGPNEDSFPSITFDGEYMFFNSAKTGDYGYNAYWVDSKVIDRFKPVGIQEYGVSQPSDIELFQNFPNPFNPSTKIRFQINKPEYVKLKIYNSQGKQISTLVNEKLHAGIYEVQFTAGLESGIQISSGIYFYELEMDGIKLTRKMIYIK